MFIGAEVSATRALIAAACLCAEAMVESGRRFSQRIGVALLIVQLLWPWALLEIGVQLTFAALVGIGIGRVLGGGSWLRSVLWVQISVWLATGMIVVAWSGNVSWAALPLNLLVAPVWSAWNCIVGVAAFLLAATQLPLGHELFELVAWVNELFAAGLLRVSETGAGGFEAEGSTRVAVAGIFALGAVAVATQAARKARSFAMVSAAR
jgi:competence protein ComEC